jgi:hypothetical protein
MVSRGLVPGSQENRVISEGHPEKLDRTLRNIPTFFVILDQSGLFVANRLRGLFLVNADSAYSMPKLCDGVAFMLKLLCFMRPCV